MGFGILFIGYFLLLNVTTFAFTDVIVGLVITLAMNKLAFVNKYFKLSQIPAGIFSLLGLLQLSVSVYDMFFANPDLTLYNIVIGISRYALIGFFTLTMLFGIEDVSKEVSLPKTAKKARLAMPLSLTVIVISAILEIPFLETVIETKTLTFLAVIMMLAFMITVIYNLTVIYSAYRLICMPGSQNKQRKTSRFKFVEDFRRHEEEKQQEYINYKLNKRKGKKK